VTRDFNELNNRMERREIRVDGRITEQEATVVVAQLLYLDEQDPMRPMTVLIDSEGGVVTATLAIYNTICDVKAPVFTLVDGMAGGTAILIAVAGATGHRRATADARYCFVPIEQADGHSAAADDVDRLRSAFATHIANHTQLDRDAVLGAMERADYIAGHEALRLGLVDEIIG
jgi:ATP-dependent Clp protease, protease subunit